MEKKRFFSWSIQGSARKSFSNTSFFENSTIFDQNLWFFQNKFLKIISTKSNIIQYQHMLSRISILKSRKFLGIQPTVISGVWYHQSKHDIWNHSWNRKLIQSKTGSITHQMNRFDMRIFGRKPRMWPTRWSYNTPGLIYILMSWIQWFLFGMFRSHERP